jgi:hypothetical protein
MGKKKKITNCRMEEITKGTLSKEKRKGKELIPEISDKARSVDSVQEMTIGDVIVSKQLDGFR